MTNESALDLVDPELRPMLEFMQAGKLSLETLADSRQGAEAFAALMPVVDVPVEVRELHVPGPPGAADVRVLVIRPEGAGEGLPIIFHIHGGGYVTCSPSLTLQRNRQLCHELQCVIVSTAYRLAPETPCPGGLEDCYASLSWVHANPGAVGGDASRIAVIGESAGGGMAASLCLLARDRGEIPIRIQHLFYPMLDDRTCVGDPHPFTGQFVWTAHNNAFAWEALLGQPPGAAEASAYGAAARAADLSGLPPTFISVGALDLFLEEDVEYARRLMRAGVPTELHVYPGAFHSFDNSPTAAVSLAATRDSVTALRRALFG